MANYNQISYGSKGDDVIELQKLLNQNGYNLDVDGKFGPKTKEAVGDYQAKNHMAVDYIVGNDTWSALRDHSDEEGGRVFTNGGVTGGETPWFDSYDSYTQSDEVKAAEDLLQDYINNKKPGDYESQWQDQLNDILQQILNREEFSYDLNGDALYQQYKDQYVTQGQLASMHTMGQAQAATGGYGNSYAQTAGQQAYQSYLQGLNDKVPELYQLALNKYNAEGDAMYNNASIMAQMENQDYSRYRDQLDDYYNELARLTDDARYKAEWEYNKWLNDTNLRYQIDRDRIDDNKWQAEFDEAKRQFDEQMEYANKDSNGSGNSNGSNNSNNSNNNKSYTPNPGWSSDKIKQFQEAHGLTVDGIWGPNTAAAYDKDPNWSPSGNGKERYANWSGGQWEAYFAHIRQTEGQAAAQAELDYFIKNGYIPTQFVSMASIGVRGGSMGH